MNWSRIVRTKNNINKIGPEECSTSILSIMAKEIIYEMKKCIEVLDDCENDERLDKDWEERIFEIYRIIKRKEKGW